MMMTKKTLWAVVAMTTLLAACDSTARLETRTFTLENIQPYEAEALIDPYVYGERPGAPGALSVTERAITVRETADNLDQIARVLEEYDLPRADVRLHFQLIQADGFTDRDERIAEVEQELRNLFQFEGYRLVSEAFVSATDRTTVEQGLGAEHAVATRIYFLSGENMRLEDVSLFAFGRTILSTTVNIRPGQTLVLGSATQPGEDITYLLTVRAEEV